MKITRHSALLTCRLFRTFLTKPLMLLLRPTFIRKLCYTLSSIVTFTFIQIFLSKLCLLYRMASELPRLLDTASEFALFSVSSLKDEKLIKKGNLHGNRNMQLQFYYRVFWIFVPNFIKIDPCNFELYRFKVGAFLRHSVVRTLWNSCTIHIHWALYTRGSAIAEGPRDGGTLYRRFNK